MKSSLLRAALWFFAFLLPGWVLGQASELTCIKNGKILIPSDAQVVRHELADYCYRVRPWTLMSEACYQGGRCRALEYFEAPKTETSAFGTPGSRLCSLMGGRAQTIFLTTNKGEQKFNRCYFSEDGSFVDLGTLWSHQTRIELEKPSKSNQPAGVKSK